MSAYNICFYGEVQKYLWIQLFYRVIMMTMMSWHFTSLSRLFKSHQDDGKNYNKRLCAKKASYSHELNSASSGIQTRDLLIQSQECLPHVHPDTSTELWKLRKLEQVPIGSRIPPSRHHFLIIKIKLKCKTLTEMLTEGWTDKGT